MLRRLQPVAGRDERPSAESPTREQTNKTFGPLREASFRTFGQAIHAVREARGGYLISSGRRGERAKAVGWTGNRILLPEDAPGVDKARQVAEDAIAKAAAELGQPGTAAVAVRAVSGVPGEALIEASAGADLVVVGSRGISGAASLQPCLGRTRSGQRIRGPAGTGPNDLERVKTAAHAHGATVNDVVLAAVAGGARALLARRGELTTDRVLKASVAASIRAPSTAAAPGNLVGILLVPVPVGEPDPIRRLERIARASAERKRLPPYQPNARLAQRWMVRAMFHQRLVNLGASNLPGPSAPLYFADAKILELFQVGVVQGNLTLTVGVLSYAGQLNFDIVGDAQAVPDLAVFANGVTEELEQLTRSHPAEPATAK